MKISTIHAFGSLAASAVDLHADLVSDWTVEPLDERTFARFIGEVEVLFGHAPPAGHWAAARSLRLIQIVGSGADTLLPVPGLDPGVPIASAPGLTSEAMAEFVIAQLLSMIKRMPAAYASQRRHDWGGDLPAVLSGRRVTVLGVGSVGREVAARLAPFKARVTGVGRRARPVPGFDRVVAVDRLDAILAETDDLVVAAPLTDATRDLVGREQFALMPAGGHLVNVARGAIIDESALIDALNRGHLAGAALDVVRTEPLPADDPLWDCPNVLISGHVSWHTPDLQRKLVELLAENIRRVERGTPPLHAVDRALGYAPSDDIA
jgi:phosphoglycerate dehydrogenase-like enzyme